MHYICKNMVCISFIVLQSLDVRCALYLCTLDPIFPQHMNYDIMNCTGYECVVAIYITLETKGETAMF